MNSRRVGWNQAGEVFDVAGAGDSLRVTVLGVNYSLALRGAPVILARLRDTAVPLVPSPAQCAALACIRLQKPAEQFCGTAVLRLMRLLRYNP